MCKRVRADSYKNPTLRAERGGRIILTPDNYCLVFVGVLDELRSLFILTMWHDTDSGRFSELSVYTTDSSISADSTATQVTYIRDLNDDFPRNPPRLPLYTPVMPQDPAHGKQAKHPLLIILVFSKNLTSLSLTRSCLVFCHKCQMTVDVRKRYAVGSLTLLTVGVLTLFG